jgi:hypothetical protein
VANDHLAKAGLRVRGEKEKAELFLPNKALPVLCKLFEGSVWASGVWAQAARRLPGAEPVSSPLTLAGARSRGVYVPVKNIAGLTGFPTTRGAAARADAADDTFPPDIKDFE